MLRREWSLIADSTTVHMWVDWLLIRCLELFSRILFVLDHELLFELSENIFDLLFDSIWVEFVCLHNVRKFALDIQLVELLDYVFVKLRDRDFVLPNVDNTMLL